MKQRSTLRRASSLWLGAALTLFCLLHSTGWAQTGVYTFGHPTLNEGGLILAESPGVGIYIGGYRADSSLIMLVDYNGIVINELTFKVSPPVAGQRDMMTDFKFDVANTMMVGTGVILNAAGNSGGYVFEFDPATFTLNWVTIFPVTLGSNFMPHSVQDLGAAFNEYRVYGSGNNSAYSVHVLVNKTFGGAGPYTFYTGPGPNDFAATAQSPAGTVYTTGRWGHTAAVADFRPSVIQVNAAGGLVNANRFTYMFPWPNATARLFSRDVIVNQQLPVTVGMGDFNGTNLNIARAFWSIHTVNTNQTNGYEINLPNFSWEDAEEVFMVPGTSGANARYIVFGEGSTGTSALADQLWMMSMNPNGTFNWAFSYGAAGREFTSYFSAAQQQCIPINSGTAQIAFTATTRSYSSSEDILLVLTNAIGDFDAPDLPCINARIMPTFIQRIQNNALQVTQPILQVANTFVNPPLRDPNLTPRIVCGPPPTVTSKLGSSVHADQAQLTLYPNPATGQVQVAYVLTPNETATLRVLDATGRILLSTELDAEASTTTLDIRNLTAGMYFVSLAGEKGSLQSAKLIVR